MKSYTSIEQSKKLADILPLESADMCYRIVAYNSNDTHQYKPYCFAKTLESDIPCWSLAALLNVIKPINENTYTIRGTLDGGAIISFNEATSVTFQEEEIIDAVFEMVVWLKENNKI